MKLKKLFRIAKRERLTRRRRRIKWRIRFFVDDSTYAFALIPTIIFVPWPVRSLGMPIAQICWLNFGISIGEWDVRK